MSQGAVAHISVLEQEVCEALRPAVAQTEAGGARVLVDATTGLGGHTAALLAQTQPTDVVLFDRDANALERAQARLGSVPCALHVVHAGFASLVESLRSLGIERVAAIVADLGVSSMQLDETDRGFSFRGDAPLDMRMDQSRGPTVADLIAEIDVDRLTKILRDYGEEPDARRIAAAIVAARPRTTLALAQVVTEATSARQRRKLGLRIHPATRTFQALRIEINDELGQLDRFLADAPLALCVGGRLAVITFHSLEDRRVKRRWRALTRPPQPPAHLPLRADELPVADFVEPRGWAGGRTPTPEEIDTNPRARSARLRVLERRAA